VSVSLHLGYVPDPLVGYVSEVLAGADGATLTVVQSNSPDTNPYLRLLLRLDGALRGPFPFDGPDWQTAA
jgi:hypothetical protein